jgi:hypothetical protein
MLVNDGAVITYDGKTLRTAPSGRQKYSIFLSKGSSIWWDSARLSTHFELGVAGQP